MSREQILKDFSDTLESVAKCKAAVFFKNHFPDEYAEVMSSTAWLDAFDSPGDKNRRVSFFERIYCVEHGLRARPMCKMCGTEHVCGFDMKANEYRKWCSARCQAADESCSAKARATKKTKYGSETYNGADKARKTRLEKNGGSWHARDFAEKTKASKLERFGNENYVNTEKSRATKLERHGNPGWNNAKLAAATKLERYGDATYNNSSRISETTKNATCARKAEIAEKRACTCKEKYGVEFPMRNADVKAKAEKTMLERHGAASAFEIPEVREKSAMRIKEKSWNYIAADKEYEPMFAKDQYIANTDRNRAWKWRCVKCGNVFESKYDNGRHGRCGRCFPNNELGYSLLENELYNYVASVSNAKVLNRTPENRRVIAGKELDILIPDMRLAIEFDGLYWHSDEAGKSKNYHLDKTEECVKAGYRLVHVFEDEWTNKKKLVKNKIRRLLKAARYRIYARKCSVERIAPAVKNAFLDKYHIQGRDAAGIGYGLFFRKRLVAVMTFCKARFDKKHEYELSRYASLNSFGVVGGAGKLLAAFEREYAPKSIVTYADRRWSVGNMYARLGFAHTHDSPPNYFYVKNGRRYSRVMFQKHRLENTLDVFDPGKSEAENMKANGFHRIYDCGNMVFEKTYR